MLDRDLQHRMLEAMAEIYPNRADMNHLLNKFQGMPVTINLYYLQEHRLVDVQIQAMNDGGFSCGDPRITHIGMDFLADDGGMAAILGAVTVKLHDETIRSLMEKRVRDSSESESVKQAAFNAIREAPASAIKQVSEFAIQKGLESLPRITQLLEMLPGS